jgi:hypothetical protein
VDDPQLRRDLRVGEPVGEVAQQRHDPIRQREAVSHEHIIDGA